MLFKHSLDQPGAVRSRGWIKYAVLAAAVALAGGSYFAMKGGSAPKKEEKKPDDKVFELAAGDIAVLAPQNLGLSIPVSGTVRPVTQAMVKSKVSGEISQLHVREGERVAAGQVLVSIDTADLRARHESQQAMIAEAKARLDLAKKTEQNNRQLLAKNFISQTAFDSTVSSLEVAESNYKAAVAQGAITQKALADAQVRAPFGGIIAKRAVNIGEKVTSDAPLVHVVDLSRMELEAPVPVSDIPSVKPGQEIAFKVDGFESREFKGKIERINPAAEAGSRSISIFVALPNADGALKGGMFANGTLAAASRTAVPSVPIAALIAEGGQSFVFAIENGKIERKPVTPGSKSVELGYVEIREGLTPGAQVLTVKADGLKHGSRIAIKDGPAKTMPAEKPKTSSSAEQVAKS
ncbi:MAG: efflux RND transporter periplasmic adaptor subunit [Betaproteobacteria bacterium]|nr:efflux RND transporter periplasmic adaptor subunit [Betaproteobacteria bacterium]